MSPPPQGMDSDEFALCFVHTNQNCSLWDPRSLSRTKEFPLPIAFGSIVGNALGPDGATLALALSDHSIRLWDTRLAQEIRTWYEERHVDEVHVCYAQFLSLARDHPTVVRLLPALTPDQIEAEARETEWIFEPVAEELLGRLLPRYLHAQVYQMLLEASASEHSARMRAMAAATENAEEMTEKLTMQANRLRQQEITEELLDVVGGAEAIMS